MKNGIIRLMIFGVALSLMNSVQAQPGYSYPAVSWESQWFQPMKTNTTPQGVLDYIHGVNNSNGFATNLTVKGVLTVSNTITLDQSGAISTSGGVNAATLIANGAISSDSGKIYSAGDGSGNFVAIHFIGEGSGITGISSGNISGVISTNNLPANLAALAQNNGVNLTGFTLSQIPTNSVLVQTNDPRAVTLTNVANTFTGVGTGLTALNASNLASGIVPTARLGSGTANSTTFLRGDNTWQTTGSVTSVGFTGDGTVYNSSVTGSPVTSSGTFAPSLATQTSNTFLVGPASGSAAAPTFRALANADFAASIAPTFNGTNLTNLNASSIVGTILDAILSTNIPRLNSSNQNWNLIGTNYLGTVSANANTNSTQPSFLATAPTTNSPSSGSFNLLQFNLNSQPVPIISYSPYHNGNNTNGLQGELGFPMNSFAFVGTSQTGFATWMQLGAGGGSGASALDLQYLTASTNTTFRGGSFINWLFGIYNGSAQPIDMPMAIDRSDTNGVNAVLSTYDTYPWGTNNAAPTAVPNTLSTPRFDVISRVGIKGYGATILDYTTTTPATTNYGANIGQASQDVYMSGPLNISVTNLSIITNTAIGTKSALVSELFIYSGISSNSLTFSNNPTFNWIWVSETGTAIAPTNIPGSTMMDVKLTYSVTGGVTNCIANYKLGAYTPYVDTDAAKFFTAVVGSGGTLTVTESNAVNALVVALKANSLWTRWDFIYPMVGGTSNSCSWNLANTNKYRIAWTVGSSTFASTGWSSDGSASFGDTQFIPSSATSPNYTQSNASLLAHNGTTSPTGTTPAYFMGATTGARFAFCKHNSSNWGLDGQNNSNGEGIGPAANGSTFVGLAAITVNSSVYSMYVPNGINGPSAITATGVPTVSIMIGCRDSGGAANFIGARFELVLGGGAISSADYTLLTTIDSQFQTSLSR